MENLLNVALVQSNIVWENPAKNRANLSEKFDKISSDVDLIVLQEMFTTGYTLNARLMAETMSGDTVSWMLKKAKSKNALIIGSIIIKQSDLATHEEINYFNRLIAAFPNGEIEYYDKRHLFSFANEDEIYTAGKERIILQYKGWKLLPLVCYDLRFPVWARNTDNYDALIYIANWPNARVIAWDTLLKARAIENLSYVIGVNRLGKDANNLEYVGHSAVIDPMGNVLTEFEENQEQINIAVLNKNHLSATRDRFRFLDDRDNFKIH